MVKLVNRAKMTTATTGTGAITLGSAASGFQSFAASGVSDGDTVRYVIEDGTAWEIGTGVYTSSGTTLSRTPSESSAGGGAISLSGNAVVYATATADDLGVGVPEGGTTGQVLAKVSDDDYDTDWVDQSGGGGSTPDPDIQEFTTPGTSTWTKPAGAKMVHILCFGGGGGGGSGRRRGAANIATTAAFGGAGGGGGSRYEVWVPAQSLDETCEVVVAFGGSGGPAITTDAADGSDGQVVAVQTTVTSLGSTVARAKNGSRGGGGTTSSATGGAAGVPAVDAIRSGTALYNPVGGLGGATNGGAGGTGGVRPGAGAGAPGFATNNTASKSGAQGGRGGDVLFEVSTQTGQGGSGGSSLSNPAGDGGDGPNASHWSVGGSGGGSGGVRSDSAGNGGNGGFPGGGGGGGAAASGSFNSGAGGNGGDGYVRITTYF
jgi:hypothetical protein